MKIAIFLPHMGTGGVERSTSLLAHEFANRGHGVTVLGLGKDREPVHYFEGLDFVHLGARRVLTGIPRLARYLRREKPDAVMSAQSYANVALVIAAIIARFKGRVVLTERLHISASLSGDRSMKTRLMLRLMRLLYRRASAITTVSQGVADDLARVTKLPPERITPIYNPTNHPSIQSKAHEPVDCEWLNDPAIRTIITVARLEPQKDLASLIEAFSTLDDKDLRLLIVGDGSEREMLEALVAERGLGDRVGFTGDVSNPYKYMARSHLFVLSSLYEGTANVLIEALALKLPVVSTDCPSGPLEVLDGGRYGTLVTTGDPTALARAIREALDDYEAMKAKAEDAQSSLERFTPEVSVARYLAVLSGEAL